MRYHKVEGNTDLVKDCVTGAIINTNMEQYKNYLHHKKIKEGEKEKIKNLENDISNIKNDLDEIKNLLRAIINESK